MDKKTLDALENDLQKAENDLQEFLDLQTEQNRIVAHLRGDFVEDKSLLNKLTEEENKLSTITKTVHELTDQRDSLQSQTAQARLLYQEGIAIETAREKAAAAASAGKKYIETRKRLVETLENLSEEMFQNLVDFRDKQYEYKNAMRDVDDDIRFSQYPSAANSSKRSRIESLMKERGTTGEELFLAATEDISGRIPKSDFDLTIETLIHQKMVQKENEARAEAYRAKSKQS